MALESREILLIKFNIYTDYIFRKLIHVASPLIINNDTLRLRYTYISQYRKFNEITHFQSKFSNSRSPKISSRLNIFETTLHLHPIPHSFQSPAIQLSKKGRKKQTKKKATPRLLCKPFHGSKKQFTLARFSPKFHASDPVHRIVHQRPAGRWADVASAGWRPAKLNLKGSMERREGRKRKRKRKERKRERKDLPTFLPSSHVRCGEVANHHLATFTTLDSPRLRSFGFQAREDTRNSLHRRVLLLFSLVPWLPDPTLLTNAAFLETDSTNPRHDARGCPLTRNNAAPFHHRR